MDHKQIISNIENGKFEKIYFLHGEEPLFMDMITNALVKHALEDHERDFNQTIKYGKEVDALTLISDAKGYPMMAERRLVILKEAQDFKGIEDLISYFEAPNDQTIFVINHKYKNYDSRKKSIKAAAKNGLVFKSEKIKEYRLPDWIKTHVISKGYSISPKASMLLAEFLGNDLSRIVNEIDKLGILVEKGTTINEVHIEENIGISKDYNVFELINAVGARNVEKANRIVDYFDHNPKATSIIVVISNLFNHYSRLMRIHFLQNKSKDSVASSLKVHPFVAGELVNSSKIYNPKKIAANIAVLHEYDLKSKGVGNASFTHGQLMKELIFRLMH
ncbi:MAG: DNA polymerase III subunit delta [Crocinitomicaceae bacterium]|nr:DNA polymerase III subunit delta [Flavobacteriales bacterium]NQZ37923.1 DNA polymerase III subunit delta [Crocinitomicaceae bacterium]